MNNLEAASEVIQNSLFTPSQRLALIRFFTAYDSDPVSPQSVDIDAVKPTASAVDDTAKRHTCKQCGTEWREDHYRQCPKCYPPPDLKAVDDAAKSPSVPFAGTLQALAASLDVELWKAMDIALYARLHPAVIEGTPSDIEEISSDSDRSAQSGESVDQLKPCPACGSPGEIEEHHADGFYRVVCLHPECVTSGPPRDHRELAIRAWNKRIDTLHDPGGIDAQSRGFTAEERLLVLESLYCLVTMRGFEVVRTRLDKAIAKLREGK